MVQEVCFTGIIAICAARATCGRSVQMAQEVCFAVFCAICTLCVICERSAQMAYEGTFTSGDHTHLCIATTGGHGAPLSV